MNYRAIIYRCGWNLTPVAGFLLVPLQT